MVWQQGQTERNRQDRERQHAPARAGGELRAVSRDERSPEESEQNKNRRQREFDEIAGEKTKWTDQRQKFRLAYPRSVQ